MKKWILIFIAIFISGAAAGAERTVNLTIGYKNVCFGGLPRPAISINQQVPGPTLHFKQGDTVTINVTNLMEKETALHWHGVLVPWQMDGVKGVNQNGIKHGETFKYKFKIEQSGTYWYHAHAGLQEQQGLYGAFVIDPLKKPSYHYNKDFVVVLSDWINTNPDQVLRNLKKSGEYYSPRFPLQSSLARFIHDYRKSTPIEREYLLDDYKMMQQMRMGIYDFSDVAYNAFLLNGRNNASPWQELVKPGDVVRLRFIGAGTSTIFHVKIPGYVMRMVHVQGNDIKPVNMNDFTIAPGETYDVLVTVQKNNPAIIYAESQDTSGAAYGALITSPNQTVNYKAVKPFPTPLPVTRTMMEAMMGDKFEQGDDAGAETHSNHDMGMGHNMNMSHGASVHAGMEHMDMGDDMKMDHGNSEHGPMMMDMPVESTIFGDKITKPTTNTFTTSTDIKYKNFKAAVPTNDPHKPVDGVINMELFGYMDKYVWFINGVPEYNAKPIILHPGKRYRFVFTNTSMMHHPMHIHGHWFILRKGNGAYDPLLHTIDVPPGATITADVDTDASGQWIFHCHFLYHMFSGMTRIFQYSTLIELMDNQIKPENEIRNTAYINRPIVRVDEVRPLNKKLIHHPMPHLEGFWLASFIDAAVDPVKNLQKITYRGLYGTDFNKLDLFVNEAEIENGSIGNADIDIFYWHSLWQFWNVKGGLNYFYRPAAKPFWQPGIGVEGLFPYFIEIDARGYLYSGSAKLDIELSRDTQITNNFFIGLDVRGIMATKTVPSAILGSGLNQMQYSIRPFYRLMPGLSIFVEYEVDQYYGAYKNLLLASGNSADANNFTVGLSMIL